MRPPPVLSLNQDLFLEVAQWLEVEDILCLRRTCNTLSHLSHLRSLWFRQLTILRERGSIPPLDRQISELAASELEKCVVRLVRLDRYWTDPSPSPRVSRLLPGPPHNRQPIAEIVLLPGGRYLISAHEDGQILCWDLETASSPPWALGRRASGQPQINWSDAVVGRLGAQFIQNMAHIVVYALYEWGDDETHAQHGCVIVWIIPTGNTSPLQPNHDPYVSFHFDDPHICIDLLDWALACTSSEYIRVIDWENATTSHVRQGLCQHGLHRIRCLKVLSSLLVFCSRYEFMLFAFPDMCTVESVNNIKACISPPKLVWKFSLDPAIHGRFRSMSLDPHPASLINTHDYDSFPLPNPIVARTDRFLLSFSSRTPVSSPSDLRSTILIHAYSLPFPLNDHFSLVHIGPSASRAIWLKRLDGGSIMHLVDIRRMKHSKVVFQDSASSQDDQTSVVQGRSLGRPLSVAVDEATGRVCISGPHSLMLYDFSPLPFYGLD